jgi:hypothetical protein
MQNILVPGLALFVGLANGFSQEVSPSVPRVTIDGEVVSAERSCRSCRDLMDRLKAAIDASDASALQALYQTNGASIELMSEELSRWRPMLEGEVKSRLTVETRGTIFRDFSLCNPMWKHVAERLSSHRSTHLVELMTSRGYWMLPLVEAEGRLFLVPSDKSRDMGLRWEDVQPDRAANVSQPVPPNTNSTSEAAGSCR